jgi:hypothetical protein
MNDNRLSFEETTRQVGLPSGKQLTPPRRYTPEEKDAAAVVARRYVAFLADLVDYALLRPVLLELKRQRPCVSQVSH